MSQGLTERVYWVIEVAELGTDKFHRTTPFYTTYEAAAEDIANVDPIFKPRICRVTEQKQVCLLRSHRRDERVSA